MLTVLVEYNFSLSALVLLIGHWGGQPT